MPIISVSSGRMTHQTSFLSGMQQSVCNTDYTNASSRAGGLPIIIPSVCSKEDTQKYVAMCDGILMIGGMDVTPSLYHSMPRSQCYEFDHAVDCCHLEIIREALRTDTPLLGCCRASQLLNVATGGNLYQHILTDFGAACGHNFPFDRGNPVPPVFFPEDSPLRDIFGTDSIMVNSIHHQANKALEKSMVDSVNGVLTT